MSEEVLASGAPSRWYPALAAGVFPPLVLGFVASALANRVVFVAWGVAAAVAYALVLRAAWQRAADGRGVLAAVLFCLALSTALLAVLLARHGEALDLGYRALLWPLYHPAASHPGTGAALAGALAAAGLLSVLWRRSRP